MKRITKLIVAIFIISLVLTVGYIIGSLRTGATSITGKVAESSTQVIGKSQPILVTEVVDGDTITIQGGARVRLLGIDAPEKDEAYYSESKEFLEDLVLYESVVLESDITDKGVYGRLLRYVWLGDELVNIEIVKNGLAIAKQYEPDIKYQTLIAEAEQEAIEKHIGTWTLEKETSYPTSKQTQESPSEIISYLDAGDYIGQVKTVEGTIVDTFKYEKGNLIFLNFHDPYSGYFTAVVWQDNWNKFSPSPEIKYKGKYVRVTGEIIEYKGAPEITISDPSQIEIIS